MALLVSSESVFGLRVLVDVGSTRLWSDRKDVSIDSEDGSKVGNWFELRVCGNVKV